MPSPPAGQTLLIPKAGRRTSGARESPTGLPADLINQSASRLRILALLYAFVFFMAGFFPALLFPNDRARIFGSFILWGPGVIAIAVALIVAVLVRSARVPLPAVLNLGLAFEVASSYGIARRSFSIRRDST